MKLPKVDDVFEYDFVFEGTVEVTELIVVDVTDIHVMYKMPSVSVNKIYPMHLDAWRKNAEKRRPVTGADLTTRAGLDNERSPVIR